MKQVKILSIVVICLLTLLALNSLLALASEASNAAFVSGIVGCFAAVIVGGMAINKLLYSIFRQKEKEKQCNKENTQQSS